MTYEEILNLLDIDTMSMKIDDIIKIIRSDNHIFSKATNDMGWERWKEIDCLGGSYIIWAERFINFRWYYNSNSIKDGIYSPGLSNNHIRTKDMDIYSIEMKESARSLSDKTLKFIILHELGHILCIEYRKINKDDSKFISKGENDEEIVCDLYAFEFSDLMDVNDVLEINKEIIDYIEEDFDKSNPNYEMYMNDIKETLRYRYNEMVETLKL